MDFELKFAGEDFVDFGRRQTLDGHLVILHHAVDDVPQQMVAVHGRHLDGNGIDDGLVGLEIIDGDDGAALAGRNPDGLGAIAPVEGNH